MFSIDSSSVKSASLKGNSHNYYLYFASILFYESCWPHLAASLLHIVDMILMGIMKKECRYIKMSAAFSSSQNRRRLIFSTHKISYYFC